MIQLNRVAVVLLSLLQFSACTETSKQPADYVNPFIGASTNAERSHGDGFGKTFPGAATPFGLVQVSPNTITGGDNGPGYSYEHTTIEGFAFTQMSGIGWYGDLGNFLVIRITSYNVCYTKLLRAFVGRRRPIKYSNRNNFV